MCSIRDEVHITKGNCIMTDTIINVSSLSFGYAGSDVLVLEDITFDIKKGEVALIIGASGSGKTTLLKMLDKSMIPEGRLSGKAEYYGRQISSLSQAEAAVKIGYVGQNPDNQIVTDKVWHELAFGLENLGVPNADIRRRVAEMSEYFGITGWYDKNTEELSGGQKQLLNLASIMVMRPEVLLLDEPTAQLDPLAKKKFIDTVLELNKDFGITIMCVEHNLADIYYKADKVLVLEDGKLIYNGSPRKTAESLVKTENPLVYGLPSSVRIYEGCKKDITFETDCPLTVKEGRKWIASLNIKEGSYVSQDNFLFHLSIRENIRIGKPEATDAEIEAAAKKASCHDFIAALPEGYDTLAGDAGSHLSGGERQRIAIARAILKNSPIVVLDEATAFTDPENEAVIQASIAGLVAGKTLIVIAHRLSTITKADKILVVDKGNVAAEGTHEELLETSNLYKELWKAHMQGKDTAEEVA